MTVYVVQGWYSDHYGWEDLTLCETREEATYDIAEYRLASPNGRHRIIQRDDEEREVAP